MISFLNLNKWLARFSARILRPYGILISLFIVSSCGGGNGISGDNQSPDAVVQDFPIVYVLRTLPVDENGVLIPDNFAEPSTFLPGAELIKRDRASPTATEVSLTAGIFPDGELYDIKDLEVSPDGRVLLFAMRAPDIPGADPADQPTWNIWKYDLDTDLVTRIIASNITAEAGQDTGPQFLPGGDIIFSSTRQRTNKAILLDEGKPQYSGLEEGRDVEASVLHLMGSDGSNIRQLTFNQSHDLDPTILTNGKIVFSRWDHMGNDKGIHLYQVNPDGTGMEYLYGANSHATGTAGSLIEFFKPQELPDGALMVLSRLRFTLNMGAELTRIDTAQFSDINQPTYENLGLAGPAQTSLTGETVYTDGRISPGGYYTAAAPLWDGTNRTLVSWAQCRLVEMVPAVDPNDPDIESIVPCTNAKLADPAAVEAPPLYSIWMLNPSENTILPIVTGEEGFIYSDVVAMQPKPAPAFGNQAIPDQNLVNEGVGILHIRSVYDFDGLDLSPFGIAATADPVITPADNRPARFLRVVKSVSIPNEDLVELDNTAFGRSNNQLMREVVGYVPIEPDGSVKFKVSANIPFAVSLVDQYGRRISQRHQNWIQLVPGEVKECAGCHDNSLTTPHGRPGAEPPSSNIGALADGAVFPNSEPALFANQGETMAETWARINGPRELSVNMVYTDDWTDPAMAPKSADINYDFNDLSTKIPTAPGCENNWISTCRIQINYEDIIQPIFELPRVILDTDGVTVLQDNTCISCHGIEDAAMQPQVPMAQLDLRGVPSTDEPDHITSYRELFFGDNAQELVNGVLVDIALQATDGNGNPIFEVDNNGNLILDANGNPIPTIINIGIAPSMSVNGAAGSARMFDLFLPGGTHAGRLTSVELKLIAEWLDIGAQYYNNPFDVPQN
jgi:hypothetical protein